jgi:hypothetical protein
MSQRTRSRRMTNDQDAAAATARLHSGSNARGVHQPDAGRSDGADGFGRPAERPRASVRETRDSGLPGGGVSEVGVARPTKGDE